MEKRILKPEAQKHVNEKFAKFAQKRGITLLGEPSFCKVCIFTAASHRCKIHTAVPAEKDCVEGYLVNVADKKLTFFAENQVSCIPL